MQLGHFKFKRSLTYILILICSFSSVGLAQVELTTISTEATHSNNQTTSIIEPLTREAIRDVISKLDDAQVRELAIQELDKQVIKREQELKSQITQLSLFDLISHWTSALGESLLITWNSVEKIPSAFESTFTYFNAQRKGESLWNIPITLILSLLSGFALAFYMSRLTLNKRNHLLDQKSFNLWGQINIVSQRFMFQLSHLITFVVGSYIANSWLNNAHTADGSVVIYIVDAIAWTAFSILCARVILSPYRSDLRLCSLDDKTAQFLTWRTGLIFGWSSFFLGLLFWLQRYNWPLGETRFGFWLGLVFYGLMALTFWQARKGITQMVLGHRDNGQTWKRFAELWPVISIILVGLQWLIIEIYIATGNIANLSPTAMKASLAILMILPLFELAIHTLVEQIWPNKLEDKPILQTAHKQAQAGLVRFGRVLFAILLVIVFSLIWDVSLKDLAAENVGAKFAREFLSIFFITLFSYGLWELLDIITNREIAIEKATMGLDDENGEQESEVGLGGTRLGTLMPLIRGLLQTVIAVLSSLAILGQLGVNITPLLAGAGVVGLAVGFGAQTLVKDIFSGMFFLIDDAFRRGEYIDLGTVKGSVEKISIRSMQLRHHNGPLNTVPFGEIRFLSNYSRDWVIMKLPLRLTYDTDGNKVRKMIKNLGKELLKHPDVGHLFIDPLKSQGVLAMEDSAMIMRIKFKTKPGDQFMTRRVVLDEIRKLFAANGIKFASREVTVRIAETDTDKPLSHEEKKQLASAAASSILDDENTPEKAPPKK